MATIKRMLLDHAHTLAECLVLVFASAVLLSSTTPPMDWFSVRRGTTTTAESEKKLRRRTERSRTTENREEGAWGRGEAHLGFAVAGTRGEDGRAGIQKAGALTVGGDLGEVPDLDSSGPGEQRPRVPIIRPRRRGRPHDCVRTLSVLPLLPRWNTVEEAILDKGGASSSAAATSRPSFTAARVQTREPLP